jgi:hypothetical protein
MLEEHMGKHVGFHVENQSFYYEGLNQNWSLYANFNKIAQYKA